MIDAGPPIPPSAPEATCPRCGYDQAGAIAAWERSDPPCCPLNAICTECGLEFAWRDLLNPVYARQLRLFEHAMSHRPSSFMLTLWRAQRGWSFWRWVRLENAVVPVRITIMVALGLPLAYVACALALGLLAAAQTGLGFLLGPMVAFQSQVTDNGFLVSRACSPLGEWPRGEPFLNSLAMIGIVAMAIMPFTFALLPDTLQKAKVRRAHLQRVWAYGLLGLPVVLAAPRMLLGFFLILGLLEVPAGQPEPVSRFLFRQEWRVLLVVMALWMASWWSWAAGRYLRLPRPWAIGFVMSVMSLLAATLLALLGSGYEWFFEGV